jgi:hypothetical protein
MLAVFSSTFVGYIWWEAKTGPGGWIVLMFLPFFNFGKLYLDISILTIGDYDFSTDTLLQGPGKKSPLLFRSDILHFFILYFPRYFFILLFLLLN